MRPNYTPIEAKKILRLYTKFRDKGESVKDIAEIFNKSGVATARGQPWTMSSLKQFVNTHSDEPKIKRRAPKLIPIPDLGPQKEQAFLFVGTPTALKEIMRTLQ